jgi:hypothetical protein
VAVRSVIVASSRSRAAYSASCIAALPVCPESSMTMSSAAVLTGHVGRGVARVRPAAAAVALVEQDDPVPLRVESRARAGREPAAGAAVHAEDGQAIRVAAGLPVDEVAVTGVEHPGLVRLDRGVRHVASLLHRLLTSTAHHRLPIGRVGPSMAWKTFTPCSRRRYAM